MTALYCVRVYDNAKANAEMQKAQLILSLQDKADKRGKMRYFAYIKEKCAPFKEYYDDNDNDDGESSASLSKITHQIYVSFPNDHHCIHWVHFNI